MVKALSGLVRGMRRAFDEIQRASGPPRMLRPFLCAALLSTILGCSANRFDSSCEGLIEPDREAVLGLRIYATSDSDDVTIYLYDAPGGQGSYFLLGHRRYHYRLFPSNFACRPVSESESSRLLELWSSALRRAAMPAEKPQAGYRTYPSAIMVEIGRDAFGGAGSEEPELLYLYPEDHDHRPELLAAARETLRLADSKISWDLLSDLEGSPIHEHLKGESR